MYNGTINVGFPKAFVCVLWLLVCLARGHKMTPRFNVVCDISGMHVQMTFVDAFSGVIFAKDHSSEKLCSVEISEKSPAMTVFLDLPLAGCGSQIRGASGMYQASNTIIVDDVNTSYILERSLLCELSPVAEEQFLSLPDDGKNPSWDSSRNGYLMSWFDIRLAREVIGVEIPQKNFSDHLLLILHINDGGQSQDLRVRNCYINNEEIISTNSTVYRMSDGCPHSDDILQFSVLKNASSAEIVAYSVVKAFAVPLKNKLYLTCGILLCKNVCPNLCFNSAEENNIVKHNSKVKRSVDESEPYVSYRYFQQRNRLMMSTIQALASELLNNKRQKYETDFKKRLSNTETETNAVADSFIIPEGAEMTEFLPLDQNLKTNYSSDFVSRRDRKTFLPTSEITIIADKNGITASSITQDASNFVPSFFSSFTATQNTNSEDSLENLYQFYSYNLTMKLSTLPVQTISPSNHLLNKEIVVGNLGIASHCVPRMKFTIVTGLFCFILLCLLLICVGLILHIRKEKKKHSVDSFLLYNYY
ncbi:uncharacterized protein LOC118202485 [Stegodyphus dumicola]|uniref:uncharacterized protein LOC118202485 n=1 Tax=Stegodyphus dumicola TaxID=202533 RepID=UPI0015AC3B45|nr:uncharacterized protein LOC118202485 [Stegodyphus dumicola]